MTDSVLHEVDGAVATITINRPAARNALTTETKVALLEALRDCSTNEAVRAVVLTGAGQAFCAGRDIKFLAKHRAEGKQTPHEDPNSPHYHWGGGGQRPSPIAAPVNNITCGLRKAAIKPPHKPLLPRASRAC